MFFEKFLIIMVDAKKEGRNKLLCSHLKLEETRMSKKYCYLFTEGNANMRELLGGKGANLAEMTNIGKSEAKRS